TGEGVGVSSTVHRRQDIVPFDRHSSPIRGPDDLVTVGAERAAGDRIDLPPDRPDAGGDRQPEWEQPGERARREPAEDEDRADRHQWPNRDRRARREDSAGPAAEDETREDAGDRDERAVRNLQRSRLEPGSAPGEGEQGPSGKHRNRQPPMERKGTPEIGAGQGGLQASPE